MSLGLLLSSNRSSLLLLECKTLIVEELLEVMTLLSFEVGNTVAVHVAVTVEEEPGVGIGTGVGVEVRGAKG